MGRFCCEHVALKNQQIYPFDRQRERKKRVERIRYVAALIACQGTFQLSGKNI